jgi:hypothetical protein
MLRSHMSTVSCGVPNARALFMRRFEDGRGLGPLAATLARIFFVVQQAESRPPCARRGQGISRLSACPSDAAGIPPRDAPIAIVAASGRCSAQPRALPAPDDETLGKARAFIRRESGARRSTRRPRPSDQALERERSGFALLGEETWRRVSVCLFGTARWLTVRSHPDRRGQPPHDLILFAAPRIT